MSSERIRYRRRLKPESRLLKRPRRSRRASGRIDRSWVISGVSDKLELTPIKALRPSKRNPRTHTRKQIRQIAASIKQFGFNDPILIDENNQIVAGHARVEAARELGWEKVPCLRADHMSAEEKQAYAIAHNKIALNAGWDETLLALELQELSVADINFGVEITGFSLAEVEELVEPVELQPGPDDRADDLLPDPEDVEPRCRAGDLWGLASHRLICGDPFDLEVLPRLLGDEKAAMVFTDPRRGLPRPDPADAGGSQQGGFGAPSREIKGAKLTRFLSAIFATLVANTKEGSIHFIGTDWQHLAEMLEAGQKNYTELKNVIVWVRDDGAKGNFYHPRHELIFALQKGAASDHDRLQKLDRHGRKRTNVWQYRAVNKQEKKKLGARALHAAAKPVAMIADAIEDVSQRGAIVIDVFGGSGSTLIAAQKTGRRARLVETDPITCDLILRRWEAFSHKTAELLAREPSVNGSTHSPQAGQ